ncbi:MAG: AzlC family ABC transporter permease [Ruminococcus sp.]
METPAARGGYLAVSFTFGMMAVQGGLTIWQAVLISLTNLTSAGQFALVP